MHYLFPFLLCIMPVHSIYAENFYEQSAKNYFSTLIIISALTAVSCYILNLFLNNLLLAEIIYCVNFYLLREGNVNYFKLIQNYRRTFFWNKVIFFLLYVLFCVFVSFLIYLISPYLPLDFIAKFLFYSCAIITFFVFLDIFKKQLFLFDKEEEPEKSVNPNLPDIYHIVMDSHTGFFYPQYRDDYFIEELEKRGFSIFKNAKSNYNYTHLSMSSMLNMDYPYNFIPNSEKHCSPRQAWIYYAKNKVFKIFRKMGYKFYTISDSSISNVINKNDHRSNKFYISTQTK